MTDKALRELREHMGLCTECGGLRLEPAYKLCERCRSKRRNNKLSKLIEEIKEIPVQKEKSEEVKSNHKCWSCVWGRFEGDRFFCPFPDGICEKENDQCEEM